MYDRVLLFSGGMDSYIAWHYLGKPPCVFFRLGHRYTKKETEQVQELRKLHEDMIVKFDVSFYLRKWEEPDAYIPGRNLLLLTAAARYSDNIVLVVQKGETDLGDRSREFFDSAQGLLSSMLGRRITVDTPFWEMTKVDMVRWYVEQGLPREKLLQTTSCYSGGKAPCGACSACIRRAIALNLNGLDEFYEQDPRRSELGRVYLERAKSGYYVLERNEDIIKWMEG